MKKMLDPSQVSKQTIFCASCKKRIARQRFMRHIARHTVLAGKGKKKVNA